LEESRSVLEENGVRIAAVSYDPQDKLKAFAEKYRVGFTLLSDPDSAVIRRFGIFNANIAPGLRAHGVPHPVEYLVSPDGQVIRKYFVQNYQHRVTASAIVLREFGVAREKATVIALQSSELTVQLSVSGSRAFAGQEIGFIAKFMLTPGWHIYGTLLPEAYTSASITFDDPNIIGQSFKLPPARQIKIRALGETLPVYEGSVQGLGSLLLRFPINPGRLMLSGLLHFQLCSDTVCEAPQVLPFGLPLMIEPQVVAAPPA
jgi:peroxiredoxin